MADLDALVRGARDATIRREVAETYVRELDRWAAPAPRAWRWAAWLPAAAAVAVLLVVVMRREAPAPSTLRIGDRVAIVAEPGTAYRVVEASTATTTIEVDHGSVTARLWPGATPHHLVLSGGGVIASAHGTIYELAVTDGHASVRVAEGTVEVAEHGELHRVTAGTAWPASEHGAARGAATLVAMPIPRSANADAAPHGAATPPATPAPPAPATAAPAATSPVQPAPSAMPAPVAGRVQTATALSIKDHWRDARLLRGQGRFAEAVRACLTIADANDATWSPIALVEAIRITLGPLADPEHAAALADRAIREWPRDALVSEVRALRCEALGQLGRAADCKQP